MRIKIAVEEDLGEIIKSNKMINSNFVSEILICGNSRHRTGLTRFGELESRIPPCNETVVRQAPGLELIRSLCDLP